MPNCDNVERLGDLDYVAMHELYHKYETVWHSPEKPCAGDRVIFEAVLSGCKLITNDNVGHMSWGFDLNDQIALRKRLKAAIYDFWHLVERVANAA